MGTITIGDRGKLSADRNTKLAARRSAKRDRLQRPWLSALLLVLCGAAAYSNSLDGPFVFDDCGDIEGNPAIRELWPIWRPLVSVVDGRTHVHSRPVVVLSFAANYLMDGLATRWFHVTNVTIHLLAGLTLFGIVRRTLLLPRQQRYARSATPLALTVALLWTLHPLQTQAVTYVVQRYESLMGLFYLTTLYAALRSATSSGAAAGRWGALSVTACLLAMGCKEVAISAPVIVLLFDRAFIAGSLREAWRRRWPLHAGLAATWLVYVPFFLVYSGGGGLSGQSSWAGFSPDKPWQLYALNQPQVILHYLRLAVWPQGQCLDYAWIATPDLSLLWPSLLVVGALLALTAGLLIWRPRGGFLGAWFFLILAPSSSVIPINDLAFEHRMYLSLAAVVTAIVFAAFELRSRWLPATAGRPWIGLVALVAVTLGILTFLRNQVYADPVTLWSDIVAKRPENGRAHSDLGHFLARRGEPALAAEHFQQTQRLTPLLADEPTLQRDWGACLMQLKQGELAVPHFLRSIAADPKDADTHLNLATLLMSLGYRTAADAELQAAVRLNPELVKEPARRGRRDIIELNAHRRVLAQSVAGDLGIGLNHLLDRPVDPCRYEYEIGVALLKAGDPEAASLRFEAANKLHPDASLAGELERVCEITRQALPGGVPPAHQSVGTKSQRP